MKGWNRAHVTKLQNQGQGSQPGKKYAYVVGVDPGTHTGIAIWSCRENALLTVKTLPIHMAMEEMKNLLYYTEPIQPPVLVRVEDAAQAVHGRDTEENRAKQQGAGSVKRDCKIWRDFLKDLGVDFQMVRPDKRKTKWDAATFHKATGWKGRTSSHARDASMLCYGW